MTSEKKSAVALGIFALAVIASGIIRYYSGPGGDKGLYFGLVMGGIALLASLLAGTNRIHAARIMGGMAIAFVVLWFAFELFKGLSANFAIGEPEVRKMIMICLGIATTVVITRPGDK